MKISLKMAKLSPADLSFPPKLQLKPSDLGSRLLQVVEEPLSRIKPKPAFVANLGGQDYQIPDQRHQDIHGSYLVTRRNVMLFGPTHLVDREGQWSCEAQMFQEQFLTSFVQRSFHASYPGFKPLLEHSDNVWTLDLEKLPEEKIIHIEEPVFLGTPLEPDNWGRWLVTVLPKLHMFEQFNLGARFFVRSKKPWQKAFLDLFAFNRERLDHDPGTTYFCREIFTIEYSLANISISEKERSVYRHVSSEFKGENYNSKEKIFISRLSHSVKHPRYRVLQNEMELRLQLESIGFVCIEPETLSIPEQVSLFANAKAIVALGGAALYNVVFCAPGTKVVTIESSASFIAPHSTLLSTMGFDYGIIFGEQDQGDLTLIHKRWTINVDAATELIRRFVSA